MAQLAFAKRLKNMGVRSREYLAKQDVERLRRAACRMGIVMTP